MLHKTKTEKILWEVALPAPGVATPAVYAIDGKQYVVIACGGSKWGGASSDSYVAFALPAKWKPRLCLYFALKRKGQSKV